MLHCSKHDKHRLDGLDCDESTRMLLCSMARILSSEHNPASQAQGYYDPPKTIMTIVYNDSGNWYDGAMPGKRWPAFPRPRVLSQL
jgi:hypothetical protein